MNQRLALFSMISVALSIYPARGQAPAAVLNVEVKDIVFYEIDTADSSKFGINPGLTPSGLSCTAPSFQGHLGNRTIALGDIVAVNGQPSKGTYALSCAPVERTLERKE